MFLSVLACAAFLFAAVNLAAILVKCRKTGVTRATVVSVKTIYPERGKTTDNNCYQQKAAYGNNRFNSKWVRLSYEVDGKKYTSDSRIQAPMAMQIGSRMRVRYDRVSPQKVYSFSWKRTAVGVVIGSVCLLLSFVK